jgi:hypothetical protein
MLTSVPTDEEGGEAVKYLNQAVKPLGKKEARKGNKGPGWLAKKTRAHVEEPHDMPYKVANDDASSKRTSTSSADDQFMTPPPIPTQPSASANPADSENPISQTLFLSHRPKRDIYDIPGDEPSKSPQKRAKPSGKPQIKQPLTYPQKSNLKGSKLPSPSEHQTRSMYMIERLGAGSKLVSEMPLADPKLQNGNAATWSNESPKVAGRKGRPRKNGSSAALSNTALRTTEDQVDKAEPQIERNLQTQGINDKTISIGDFEDILDSMMENPSPLKVNALSKAAESNKTGMPLQSTAPRPVQKIHEVDDSEDESVSEEEIDSAPLDLFKFSEGSNFESNIFGEMLLKVKRVGHTFDEDTRKLSQKKAATTIYSSHGKRLNRRLTYLVKAYVDLRAAKAGGISPNIQEAQSEVDQMIGKVDLAVDDILTDRLGDYGIIKPNTPTILTDLYVNLLPTFVSAIKTAFDVQTMDTIEGLIGTPALEELSTLLNLLLKLAVKAVAQPKDEHSKTQHSAGNRISKPTREVIPMIREVRDKFSTELKKRRRTREISRREKTRVEREEARKLADHERRLEIQRKKNEIRRLQKKALDEKLADPFCGPWIRGEVARNEAREQARKQEITYENCNPETVKSWRRPRASALDVDTEEEPDPFDDEYYDRVRVFGKRNMHERRTTKPLSNEEKAIFIDTMRVERGN